MIDDCRLKEFADLEQFGNLVILRRMMVDCRLKGLTMVDCRLKEFADLEQFANLVILSSDAFDRGEGPAFRF
jgi:hypothetical protein